MATIQKQLACQLQRFNFIKKTYKKVVKTGLFQLRPLRRYSRQEVVVKIELLRSTWNDFADLHKEICNSKTNSDEALTYFEQCPYENCMKYYSKALSQLLTMQESYINRS
ncbi:uncharacterized protein LOC127288667 [Leptopilina boulardi]|uniref:uncharacterized protein LOC127288667 n=1 Tax=Leptopilina boulardi TaxID=63433 RepID=UPI0021F64BF0|nr:uncharacterized protein LOC127288667 [Leptopilina boulardi]